MRTPKRLAAAIRADRPDLEAMAKQAEAGAYDDFESQSAFPQHLLISDLMDAGALLLAARARRGEFEATMAEAHAWAERDRTEAESRDLVDMVNDSAARLRKAKEAMEEALAVPDRRRA